MWLNQFEKWSQVSSLVENNTKTLKNLKTVKDLSPKERRAYNKVVKPKTQPNINRLKDVTINKEGILNYSETKNKEAQDLAKKTTNWFEEKEWAKITVNFAKWWKEDVILYHETTLWKILWNKVWEVSVVINWKELIYTRKWEFWEFYDKDWNRKVIKTWDKLVITKIRNKNEIENLHLEWNKKILLKFLTMEQIRWLSPEKWKNLLKLIDKQKEYLDYILKYSHDFRLDKKNNKFTVEKFEEILKVWEEIQKDITEQLHLNDKQKKKFYDDTRWMSIMQIAWYVEKFEQDHWKSNIDYDNWEYTYEYVNEKKPMLPADTKLNEVKPNVYVKLNKSYNQFTLDKVPKNTRDDVAKIIKTLPKWWGPLVIRNAIKNPKFSAKKPMVIQNLSYKTAVIYYPWQEKADVVPVLHWNWLPNKNWSHIRNEVSNIKNSNWSSLWSKYLEASSNESYQYRLIVHWEERWKKYSMTREEAQNIDATILWNSNDESRYIRTHEKNLDTYHTAWCVWLPVWVARKLFKATQKYWGADLEIFVSVADEK